MPSSYHAFPIPENYDSPGMSTQDFAALIAMQGILANPNTLSVISAPYLDEQKVESRRREVAEAAYAMAEAMYARGSKKS